MHPVASQGAEWCTMLRGLAGASAGDDHPLDGVVHITAAEESTNPATILNAALRRIFPTNSAIPPTAAVTVLEDHQVDQPINLVDLDEPCCRCAYLPRDLCIMTVQVPHASYLKKLLPHLGWGGVRLVHSPISYENIRQVSDVYDQVYSTPLSRKAMQLSHALFRVAPLLTMSIMMLGAARDILADTHAAQSRGVELQRL